MAKSQPGDNLTAMAEASQEAKENLELQALRALHSAEGRRKELTQQYRNEKRVPVYLSPFYRPHFGNVMPVIVNGIRIYFPVDGQVYHVPQTFADEIAAKRMAVDEMLTKQNRMADIHGNFETAPGELNLF